MVNRPLSSPMARLPSMPPRPETCMIERRRVAAVALGLAVPLGLAGGVLADPAVAPPRTILLAQAGGQTSPKATREQELEAVRAEQRKAAETEARLRAEVESIGEDRRKLNEVLIATAARLREVEDRMAATEARLKSLASNELGIRKSLDGRQAVIVEILAALQR